MLGITENCCYMLMQGQLNLPAICELSYNEVAHLLNNFLCDIKGYLGTKPYGLTGEGSRSFHRQCGLVSHPTSLIAWAMVPCPRCHTSEISQPENQLPSLTQSDLLDAVYFDAFVFGHLNHSFYPLSHRHKSRTRVKPPTLVEPGCLASAGGHCPLRYLIDFNHTALTSKRTLLPNGNKSYHPVW